jgi:hypothetical protein
MPVLRFAHDRRGYESTYLVESARRGPDGPSLLYWFRTPAHVKVGRAAFDEEAIRLLEEQHPDIDFDWDRILAARPPAPPEAREVRYPRSERRPAREGRREGRERPVTPPAATAPPAPAAPAAPTVTTSAIAWPAPAAEPPATATRIISPVALPDEPRDVRQFVRVFDQPDEPSHPLTEPSAAERLLGPERLTILRARYAEILARITARGGDQARLDALREQAERINPDAWVTEAEVTAGIASVDAVCDQLHRLVGRRRRRRRRGNGGGRDDEASLFSGVPGEPPEPVGGPAGVEIEEDMDDEADGDR